MSIGKVENILMDLYQCRNWPSNVILCWLMFASISSLPHISNFIIVNIMVYMLHQSFEYSLRIIICWRHELEVPMLEVGVGGVEGYST